MFIRNVNFSIPYKINEFKAKKKNKIKYKIISKLRVVANLRVARFELVGG